MVRGSAKNFCKIPMIHFSIIYDKILQGNSNGKTLHFESELDLREQHERIKNEYH